MSRPQFAFEDTKPMIADQQPLDDIRAVAGLLGVAALPQRLYRHHGRYSTTAIKSRFGSWNVATAAAGLASAGQRFIAESELFDNLGDVWITLGREARRSRHCVVGGRSHNHGEPPDPLLEMQSREERSVTSDLRTRSGPS